MPEDLPTQPGSANSVKNRSKYFSHGDVLGLVCGKKKLTDVFNYVSLLAITGYYGVYGEMNIRDDSESAVGDDSNRADAFQRLVITAQSQLEPQRPEKMSNRQCESLEAQPQTLLNMMEDSLLQLSPRISIPRKQMAAAKSKQHTKEIDKALDGRTKVSKDFDTWLFIYFHMFVFVYNNEIKYGNKLNHMLYITCS